MFDQQDSIDKQAQGTAGVDYHGSQSIREAAGVKLHFTTVFPDVKMYSNIKSKSWSPWDHTCGAVTSLLWEYFIHATQKSVDDTFMAFIKTCERTTKRCVEGHGKKHGQSRDMAKGLTASDNQK